MNLLLLDVANFLHQTVSAPTQAVNYIMIDSRLVQPNTVFVAIKGAQFDGHDFARQAQAQGACAIVAQRPIPNLSIPVFFVEDTRLALGAIAAGYRQHFHIPFIGVTGSCGKTSTTALIASVLATKGQTLATHGTLNNEIGVPLTLFRLSEADQFAVIEMGANHSHEIDYLTKITRPTVSLITNAAPVHLEGFGSLDGVRRAKGEIYHHLADDGIAIINADDPGANYWLGLLKNKKVVRFGFTEEAEITAKNISLDDNLQAKFCLTIAGESTNIHLTLIGAHQVSNALAAAAVGFSQGLSLAQIKTGLEATTIVAQRGVIHTGYRNMQIIDDSYNANPTAFAVAIDLLMALKKAKCRVLVMGDMGELGPEAEFFHAEVGRIAKQKGIDALYSVGLLSKSASSAFGVNGKHFTDQASLIQALNAIAAADLAVLIKGSKSSHMSNVVSALCGSGIIK